MPFTGVQDNGSAGRGNSEAPRVLSGGGMEGGQDFRLRILHKRRIYKKT